MIEGQEQLSGLPPPVPAAAEPLAGELPRGLFLGTSSWAFPGWRGLVYADAYERTVLSRLGLHAYGASGWLRTVSVDRAFYAGLSAGDYARLAEQVPGDFRFVSKLWQRFSEPRLDESRRAYAPFDRLVAEDPSNRASAVAILAEALAAGGAAFLIANNKAEGSAPLTLARIAEALAWPDRAPDPAIATEEH